MPKIRVSGTWPHLDKERYLRDLKATIDQAMIKAARKFLLAAVPNIPVFTGMARGAFGNLEDIAGRVQSGRIRGTLQGSKKRVNFQKPRRFYYYPPNGSRIVRDTQAGRQFATKPEDILGNGQLTRASTGTRVVFKFAIDISYFNYLDEHKWHAFKAGYSAFNEELKVQLNRLPDLGKYVIRKEIK
jgi:hypothetical protein